MSKNPLSLVVGGLLIAVGIAAYCVYQYIIAIQANTSLQSELDQVQQDISQLELVRDNLSSDLEKSRETEKTLIFENTGLKDKIKADQAAFTALESSIQQAQENIDTLNGQISVARQENAALITQIDGLKAQVTSVSQEKDQMTVTLSSVDELKKAIKALKRKTRLARRSAAVTVVADEKKQVKEILFGNRGFLVKDGKVFTPSRVKIEVQATAETK
jgi:chromosome segregation ATPase